MAALLWIPLAAVAGASATTPPREVRVFASDPDDRWRATALETVAADALAELDGPTVVFEGAVAGDRIYYKVSQRGADDQLGPPVHGSIALPGNSRASLARAITAAAESAPAVGSAVATRSARGPPAPAPPLGALVIVLLIAALVVVAPLLVFAGSIGRALARAPKATLRDRRSLRWTAGCLFLLAGFGVAIARSGWPSEAGDGAFAWYLAGGIAWGAFVAANARALFPVFSGLGRVEHHDVFRLLSTWTAVTILRAIRLALYYAPFIALLLAAAHWLDMPRTALYDVALPVWGLMARLVFVSLAENAAAAVDQKLVADSVADDAESDPWHQAVLGYFLGYVSRLGWNGGESLARNVLFLPGRGDQVHVYGGGLGRSRVVIGTELLEFALAPYGRPHDYVAPREDKLFWSDWHAGLIVPTAGDTAIASKEARTVPHHAVPGDEDGPLMLGQPPTLAGFVEPSALDKRHTFRPAEDPTWLEWDPGSDYDGTDPGDHDFLFGAVVSALGTIERSRDQAAAIALAMPRASRLVSRARGKLGRAYDWLVARPQRELEDAFVAVNFARHHQLQNLSWRLHGDDSQLTSRAQWPELERTSAAIARALQQSGGDEGGGAREQVSERARFLTTFSRTDGAAKRSRMRRMAPLLAIGVAVTVALAVNVIRSIQYHPTYVERTTPASGGDSPASTTP